MHFLEAHKIVHDFAGALGHLETTNEMCYNYDMSETAEKTRALRDLSS